MIEQLYEDFTRRCGPCCIAGGAPRDVLMDRQPKDWDVFLLTDKKPEIDDLDQVDLLPFHPSEPFLQATVKWNTAIVQVMRPPVNTREELLDTFDWNVSLFAYDDKGFCQRTRLQEIAAGQPLKLQKLTYPLSTLRRGFRFSERFGMELQEEDLVKIMAAYLKTKLEEAK